MPADHNASDSAETSASVAAPGADGPAGLWRDSSPA